MNTVGKSPGVYIEEVTGPGVIAGVGTSTAAFIGPALNGPLLQPVKITTYDDFLRSFAALQNGALQPLFVSGAGRRFHLASALQGFFVNGGSQAYVVRVGTGVATAWDVLNQGGQAAFRLQALAAGADGDDIKIETQPAHATGAGGVAAAAASAKVTVLNGLKVTVDDASSLRVGDLLTKDQTARAALDLIEPGNVLTLHSLLPGLAVGDTLQLANLAPADTRLRLAATTGLFPGSVVLIQGDDAASPGTAVHEYAVVTGVDAAGFVTFAPSPARAKTFNLSKPTQAISQEFRLIVTPPPTSGGPTEMSDNLSLNPLHPGYVFSSSALQSSRVQAVPPAAPPTTSKYPDLLVAPASPLPIKVHGKPDDPGALGVADYQAGLDALSKLDDVNLIVIPDAAAHTAALQIQQAMLAHCEADNHKDRFAILDSLPGAPPSGPGSVDEQRGNFSTKIGFAALYYPWLIVADPLGGRAFPPPPPIAIPPSGHLAGIYARTDDERGVHKAPANTAVRGGVIDIERRLSNAEQGPLNEKGVNVLRIFQGSSAVQVWGARTVVDAAITDWRYVSIRRLLIYIEQSIEVGIRWAVFEPNNLALWKKLTRTISEFLTRVWRAGALFGATPDKAFYVRIDEGLNPPSVRALGQLYIEIGVAPSYPAEFIIVRIGLWDGGAAISEG
jgi:phage tail sheath protein FI